MTRVALYARFSSENQREASIDDQFRNCENFAKREGWEIVERFEDRAISGTHGEAGRPGYRDMLAAAKSGHFDILLIDDLSRLSRDSVETEQVRRRLVHWGIRLISIGDGVDTNAKGHKMLSSFKGIMNEVFLDDLRDKTHRGLTGQALKGHNCGGRSFGYKHVPITDPTQKDEYGRPKILAVKREIDEAQAKWVRWIFEQYAQGQSPRWIARELNRQGVPGPGAAYNRQHKTRLHGTWSPSALHGDPKKGTGLLHNPLYVGRPVWNRRKWIRNPETNRKTPRMRPQSEWIVTEQPELRIVDKALWDKVQVRRKSRPVMKKGTPALNGRYLLSGLLVCSECGSRFVIADARSYGCAGHLNRGACANDLRVRRDLVEQKCLGLLTEALSTPEHVTLFVKETTRLLTERAHSAHSEVERLTRRLSTIEQQLHNLLTAIKAGIVTASTKDELQRLEAERDRLRQQVQAPQAKIVSFLPRAKARYEALLANLSQVSPRHRDPLREQIQTLVGEIQLKPMADGYLEAIMPPPFEGMLKLVSGIKNAVGCGGRI